MDDLIFIDKSNSPTELQLKSTLKLTFPLFKKIDDLTKDYLQEWKYYNKKSGWIFKKFTKKKVLFYITPLEDYFRLGFTVNEADKDIFLNFIYQYEKNS